MLLQKRLIGPSLGLLMIFVIESATDERPSLQSYFPLVTEEQLLSNDKRYQQIMQGSSGKFEKVDMVTEKQLLNNDLRFQQMMQGSSGTSDVIWPEKHKFEKVDMVTEKQLLNNDFRFQQMMQGSSGISDAIWPEKHKFEKVDIEKEINQLNNTYVYQTSWPAIDVKLGSVTAVTFDKDNNVVIFHRCDRIWEQDSFSIDNVFTKRSKGPIHESTVLALNKETGRLVYDWGKNVFYMPHGLTIDREDNVWITDVALHQVFKFGPRGSSDNPLMVLGIAFTPGAGETKFCKPTSVAVLENGDFFVADGYCNARILKYSKNGNKILQWGQNTFAGVSIGVAPPNFFAIPHALTLVPEKKLICVADRENGRVQCFFWSNGIFHSQYHSQLIGDRLFSMDYTPAQGGQFVIVNGPTDAKLGITESYNAISGYVMDFNTKKVTAKFGQNDTKFSNPHDVAVSVDGKEIYVAELNPMRIHKFLHKSLVKSIPLSVAKPTANVEIPINKDKSGSITSERKTDALSAANSALNLHATEVSNENCHRPGTTAIVVASLMLLFAFLTFGLALLIARRRKRGCMPFGTNNRRHAWDFPSKQDGFKLGGLLERNKRSGFEKLDQNASDEETETVTNNTLTSAQFA